MAGRRSFARRPPPGGIVHQSGHDDSGPAIAAVPGNQAWPSRCRPGWSRISQPAEDPGIPSLRQQTPAQIMRTASPSGCKLKLTTNSEVLPPHSHETGSAARASAGPGAAPADLSVRRCCIRTGTVRSVSAGGRSSLRRRWWRARDTWVARALMPRRRLGNGAGLAGGKVDHVALGCLLCHQGCGGGARRWRARGAGQACR